MTIRTMTISGVTEVNFDPQGNNPLFYTSERFVWVKNLSEDDMFISSNSSCTANSDGTAYIPAGEAASYNIPSSNKIYISGTGKAEIRTSEIPDCPFKTQAGGGDLSDYYTKSEVNDALLLKANTADVYTKTQADSTFVENKDINIVQTPTAAEIRESIRRIWGET